MSTQDGRLELDELGSVIDDAASLGDARETLGEDRPPTLGQRVAATGVGEWTARHRGLVRGAAVVAAVAAVAWVVRAATAPPPPSDVVVAVVAPDLTSTDGGIQIDGSGDGLLTSRWLLSDVRPGESVVVTGIDGPGVRATSAQPVGAAAEGVQRWSVAAVLGCEGTEALATAGADDLYSLALERTDTWGRVARSSIPLPPGSPGWSQLVGEVCWGAEAARGVGIDGLTARADTTRGVVTVGLDISSRLAVPALVGLLDDAAPGIEVGRSFLAPLVAGEQTQLDATLRVTSCDPARMPMVIADPRLTGGRLVPGLPLLVQAARDDRTATVPVLFDAQQTELVRDAVDLVCAGAPRITAQVVSARPVTSGVVGVEAAQPLEVRVRVTSDQPGRAAAFLESGGYFAEPSTSHAFAEVGAAGTVMTLGVDAQCATTPPPPRLRITIDVDGRARPWSGLLDDAVLEDALLAACDGLTPEMLVTSGWPSRTT